MKLFDGFEAVKEDDWLFIKRNNQFCYIYNSEDKVWMRADDDINRELALYAPKDVTAEELCNALHGVFPTKESDFLKLCHPSQVHYLNEMMDILLADYMYYMSDYSIYHLVYKFLHKSEISHLSFVKIKELFNNAIKLQQNNNEVFIRLKELCFAVIGRDIFNGQGHVLKRILNGYDDSSYFWILPVKVVDYTDTNDLNCISMMRSVGISIEVDDVYQYITPFLYKHFDTELVANQKRVEYSWTAGDGTNIDEYIEGFAWDSSHNFFTLDSARNILKDIEDTIDAMSSGKENEFTNKLLFGEELRQEYLKKIKVDQSEVEEIIGFLHRFCSKIGYLIEASKNNGYDLISFVTP